MIDLVELTVDQVHEAYKAGTFSCQELVQACLDRIEAVDRNGPKLNSVLAISPTALKEAEAADRTFLEKGEFTGPLHGIPAIIKDQVETKGTATTYGSVIAKGHVPDDDATLVKKLKMAGAIVIAKSTMPDWATSFFSTSSLSGVTCNPYGLDRDPGGSSSGTGAAIAANLAILGLGEDTGGSIRVPSSFCSLVGLRCTPGLISRNGLSPLIVPQDTPGPMCRTVRDTALMLDAMVGFDEKDTYTSTAVIAGVSKGGSYASTLDTTTNALSKARIGVLRSSFGDDSNPACKAVNGVIHTALSTLEKSGTTFVDITIPNLEHYLSYTPTYFTRSRSDLDAFLASKPASSPLHTNVSAIHSSKAYHPALDLFEGIATSPAAPEDDPIYFHRLETRDEFVRLVISIMASHDVSAIAMPDCQIPAPTHEEVLSQKWSGLGFPTNTLVASQLRFPAVSVPAGFTAEGLPVGLEFVGLPYHEQHLLDLASGAEVLVKGRRAPKL